MFKLMLTIKKKKGITRQEFMDHYDKVHLALAKKIMPPLHLHRRNYVYTDHPFYTYVGDNRAANKEADRPFDVIVEVFWETEADARKSMDAMFNGDTNRQITEDETNFCEPGGVNFYVVEVHQSAIPW